MLVRLSVYIMLLVGASEGYAQSWTAHLPNIGSFSSPRAADLNGDGILDVIVGAGREEFQSCDTAVLALNGKNGHLLWHVGASDQIFGSPLLIDITQDGISDIVIGGRSAELLAIDGLSGRLLWRFSEVQSIKVDREHGWFNFYNAVPIPDQDDDGVSDLLISNGGDVLVEPYDTNRPPGSLAVVSAASGKLLARATMPDQRETYQSPVYLAEHHLPGGLVVFGTGGETVGGHLYACGLSEVMQEDLSQATQLAQGKEKGFISPVVLADVTQDQVPDIIATSVDGRVLAFSGADLTEVWSQSLPNTEAYSALGVGDFNGDGTPDFFASVAQGVWPKLEWNRQFLLNGIDGSIELVDSLGFYQTSSPVMADLTGNGKSEIILSVNIQEFDTLGLKYFRNMVVILGHELQEPIPILDPFPGSNLSSTPWIGDLDANGKLDIIYLHGTNDRQTYTFDGMNVLRLATDLSALENVTWGGYMGASGSGVFRPKTRQP